MKQVIHSLKNGKTTLTDTPVPSVTEGKILIKTKVSLISPGTEKMLIDFGKSGILGKARAQPDKLNQVLEKIKTDGMQITLEKVLNKINDPVNLGYCNVGVVVDVGEKVTGFSIGDRVISNGEHAEIVSVPSNLCVKLPDSVTDENASFVVLGAVALQAIRLANPTIGETAVIFGLGLVGLISVQLLRANGCKVMGIDFDEERLAIGKSLGAEIISIKEHPNPYPSVMSFTEKRGADFVLITASTKSNKPISQAAEMCRKRGRIVLSGVTGLNLKRDLFYKKEITFQVSSSYGPGRYDKNYEEEGMDYPLGFVRWTAKRNFEAIIDLMASGHLDPSMLISHRFSIKRAPEAYEILSSKIKSLGIVLIYPGITFTRKKKTIIHRKHVNYESSKKTELIFNFIGAGNFAGATLIPSFKSENVRLNNIASMSGLKAAHLAKRFGFSKSTSDLDSIFSDKKVGNLVIATRHDSHCLLVLKALRKNMNVFVEKPLCLNLGELQKIKRSFENMPKAPLLMVGFNRRFAPHIEKIKSMIEDIKEPKTFTMTVNAGPMELEHWVNDTKVGGGRVVGEVCHFIDLLRFLSNSPIVAHSSFQSRKSGDDTTSIYLEFLDGSIGNILYIANGSSKFPKERLEVFTQGKVLQLDNYRKLKGFGWSNFKRMNLWKQDKGHKKCVKVFVESIRENKAHVIPFEEIVEVTKTTIELSNTK